ncbi:alpha/beta fold hydrolase [Candidatus Saccharibacteria bacterium]|nr:alpha/beta fold hydrolase [Candidatus Saccharibacteria bacterium]
MTQEARIPTKLGTELAGILHSPADDTAKHPVVVLLHGFTGWKEEEHIATLADRLCEASIAALRIDAPGSGESGGTFEQDYTMTNYIAVVEDVIAYVKSLPELDAKRIGIWGHSMGGFVALASAVRYPQITAVCCSQPSSGWKVMDDEAALQWKDTGWAMFRNRHFPEIHLPYSFLVDRSQYNALDEAPKLTIPSLFIAGTQDTDVVPAGVKAMAALAPQPSNYLEFDTGHHYKLDPGMLATINEATVQFFTEYL